MSKENWWRMPASTIDPGQFYFGNHMVKVREDGVPVYRAYRRGERAAPPGVEVSVEDGEIRVPIASMGDMLVNCLEDVNVASMLLYSQEVREAIVEEFSVQHTTYGFSNEERQNLLEKCMGNWVREMAWQLAVTTASCERQLWNWHTQERTVRSVNNALESNRVVDREGRPFRFGETDIAFAGEKSADPWNESIELWRGTFVRMMDERVAKAGALLKEIANGEGPHSARAKEILAAGPLPELHRIYRTPARD
jgi:hypothetical protein